MATVVLSPVCVCVFVWKTTRLGIILHQCEDQVFRTAIHRGLIFQTNYTCNTSRWELVCVCGWVIKDYAKLNTVYPVHQMESMWGVYINHPLETSVFCPRFTNTPCGFVWCEYSLADSLWNGVTVVCVCVLWCMAAVLMLSLARHTSICAAVLVTAPLRDHRQHIHSPISTQLIYHLLGSK